MSIRIFLFILIWLLTFPQVIMAEENDAFRSTDYPLPRFVSLNADEAYVRAGPGSHFPIQWVFNKHGLPVEIILEFEHWRKIRDIEGEEGWIHQSLLSGKRTALILAEEPVSLRRKPEEGARLAAYIEPGALAGLKECREKWCELEASGYRGWVERRFIWGVYENETLE